MKFWPTLLCVGVLQTAGFPVAAESVDMELIIAIDVSSSVDEREYRLQMGGIAAAFRHPAVLDAIGAMGPGGLAVTVVQWSDNREQASVTDWQIIRSTADAAAYSRLLRSAPRAIPGGQTSIAGAIAFAMQELESNGIESNRRVIDVSGDGRANNGVHPMTLRDLAIEQGVTVNGLAIVNEEPFLDNYFEHSVIGGVGSFLMVADDYRDFAAAIQQKLLREIGLPVALQNRTGSEPAFAAADTTAPGSATESQIRPHLPDGGSGATP